MFSTIQTTGYVAKNGSIVLSGSFPEKERVRCAHHSYPAGTKLKVEMFYQKDNFHGKDFHDYLLKASSQSNNNGEVAERFMRGPHKAV